MQVDGRCPLGFIFLVYADVVAVACEARSGSAFDLNPGVVFYDVVFAEFGLVHHDLQLVMAFAAPHGDLDEQVMVLVSDIRDFNIVSAEFLRNFVLPVDAVLEESAAFDFPAVVDAATGGKACGNPCNPDESCCELCRPCMACNLCAITCQKGELHVFKIEKTPGLDTRRSLVFGLVAPNARLSYRSASSPATFAFCICRL